MNDDLIEDDNELNFEVMNEMWTRQENNQKEKNDIKDKNNKKENLLKKNSFRKNINNVNKQKDVKKIKAYSKK